VLGIPYIITNLMAKLTGWILVQSHHCHLKTMHLSTSDRLEKKPQEKQTCKSLAMIHTWIIGLLV